MLGVVGAGGEVGGRAGEARTPGMASFSNASKCCYLFIYL